MQRQTPEKTIENHILNFLWRNRIFAWKNQTTGIFDPVKKVYRKSHNPHHIKGVSDILGVLPLSGRLLAIEVKSKTGRLSEDQKRFLERVNAEGGLAFIARSLEDVEQKLSEVWGKP